MNINQPAENITLPFVRRPKRINLTDGEQLEKHRRLAFVQWMPSKVRNDIVAFIGELVGTFMFLFLAFGATQVANIVAPGAETASTAPNTSNLLYISLAFGFSLAVNAWVFFRISGGLFNPAVTLGMCLIGAIPWIRGLIVVLAQLIGAIAASGVVSAILPGPMLVTTALSPQTSVARGVFLEMFLTAELVFTIFMLAAEKHKATFIAPVGIGLALFVAELVGIYFTGGSLNPARSFGPAVVNGDFVSEHWIYWVGPFLGSLLAVAFYKLVKGLEYETVNPGQDAADEQEKTFVNHDVTPVPAVVESGGSTYASQAPLGPSSQMPPVRKPVNVASTNHSNMEPPLNQYVMTEANSTAGLTQYSNAGLGPNRNTAPPPNMDPIKTV